MYVCLSVCLFVTFLLPIFYFRFPYPNFSPHLPPPPPPSPRSSEASESSWWVWETEEEEEEEGYINLFETTLTAFLRWDEYTFQMIFRAKFSKISAPLSLF